MTTKKKKRDKHKPIKPKIDPMAGMPRPKPMRLYYSAQLLEQARNYPLLGCWIMQGWRDQGLTPVIVARQQPDERVTYVTFLVDIYCLGVKNALWRTDVSARQLDRDVSQYCGDMPEECDASLAHELIYSSIDYARKYGFEPHRDFAKASLILDPPDAHPWTHQIRFGKDDKPFFVSGPDDNARAIINQLMRTAGEGNFNYLGMLGDPEP